MSDARHWMPLHDPYGVSRVKPRLDQWIDIKRGDEGEISTHRYGDLHPLMNVIGLYWRPSIFTDAGKEIEGEVVGGTGIEPVTYRV